MEGKQKEVFLNMRKIVFLLCTFLLLTACKNESSKAITESPEAVSLELKHAEGFKIQKFEGYKTITLLNPWPGADRTFTYALVEENGSVDPSKTFDAIVQIPVQKIVVTSTTHIPSLEALDVQTKLVGFPHTDYISSEVTRALIDNGSVREVGKNEDLNTEVLLEIDPDVVIGFAVDNDNSTFATLQKTGIPVLYNSDWTEMTPLGKAEWIKFFGVLFGKEEQAETIFNKIETEYLAALEIAAQTTNQPTILSGAMYKDIWYLPQGNSWAAQLIKDANGNYLWSESTGTGSISANLEAVLDKGQHADLWIGPGQFSRLDQMQEAHSVYAEFDAFKNSEVYSFTTKKGATGGVLYYELAPNRPDLVLKDIIKILHPGSLPDHELFFFSKLQ